MVQCSPEPPFIASWWVSSQCSSEIVPAGRPEDTNLHRVGESDQLIIGEYDVFLVGVSDHLSLLCIEPIVVAASHKY